MESGSTEKSGPLTRDILNLVDESKSQNMYDGPMELYQPLTNQILLYDLASSVSVNALFKLSQIHCNLRKAINAEFMSTNGKLPLVRSGNRILCGFEEVSMYLQSVAINKRKLDGELAQASNVPAILDVESRAYIDWIEANFLKAEMFTCWCQEQYLHEYTYPRYTFALPAPLNNILFYLKKRDMQAKFSDEKSTIMQDFDKFLHKLEKDLKQRRNFNPADKSSWRASDALIAGHVKAIKESNNFILLEKSVSSHEEMCKIMTWFKNENFI